LLRGPHNIARTVLEFAIDERAAIVVYLGSPTEIASTLYALGSKAISRSKAIFDADRMQAPYLLRPAYALTPEELQQFCEELALPMSTRSARRILDGEIEPLVPHLQSLVSEAKKPIPQEHKAKARSRIQIANEDKEALLEQVSQAYGELARKYYLTSEPELSLAQKGNTLRIAIELKHED
jgi:predicted Zn-dependent protease with MMP-like domain